MREPRQDTVKREQINKHESKCLTLKPRSLLRSPRTIYPGDSECQPRRIPVIINGGGGIPAPRQCNSHTDPQPDQPASSSAPPTTPPPDPEVFFLRSRYHCKLFHIRKKVFYCSRQKLTSHCTKSQLSCKKKTAILF